MAFAASADGSDETQGFSLKVIGNERLSSEFITQFVDERTLKDPTDAKINALVRQLFATEHFTDIAVEKIGAEIKITVKEKPILIRIAFEGNDALSNEYLAGKLSISAQLPGSDADIAAASEQILELYRLNGYFNAVIEAFKIDRLQNTFDLVFTINERSQSYIQSISFVGNKIYRDCDLRKLLYSTEKGYVDYERALEETLAAETEDEQVAVMADFFLRKAGYLSPRNIYDPESLEYDKQRLKRFYLDNGYAAMHIMSATADLSFDRTEFFVTFSLIEGQQYQFGDLELRLNLPFEVERAPLAALVPELAGETYNASKVEEIIDALEDHLLEQGFSFINIRPLARRDETSRTIDIQFDVAEGPRVYVERINIEGNNRTLDRVIRSQIDFVEGDAFIAKQVSQARQRVRDLGYFSEVDVRTERGSDDHSVIIDVSVVEQSTGSLELGIGFSTDQGPILELGIYERNLMGRGQTFIAQAIISADNGSYTLAFSLPEHHEGFGGAKWGLSFRTGDGDDLLTPLMGLQLVFYLGYWSLRLPIMILVLATGAYYCWLWRHDIARRRRRYRRTMRTVTAIAVIQLSLFLSSQLSNSIFEVTSVATSQAAAGTCA